ncbi:MAG TPA: hypothetical protein ENI44_03110 [Thermoplasmatales archaeon]|nr:hypothetical protein [Thermoplasmatales archaeon]
MNLYRKTMVLAIVGLFFGAGIVTGGNNIYRLGESERVVSNILYVDDDGDEAFTEIWDAVNHSHDGDTIYVYCGTYREHIIIDKSINLIGESKDCVIIDGKYGSSPIITITANSVLVQGFTIRNGGVGIDVCSNGNEIIDNNIVRTDGVYLSDANDNHIYENFFSQSSIYIVSSSTGNVIESNIIVNGGVSISSSYGNEIRCNHISSNSDVSMDVDGSSNIIEDNIIKNSKSSGKGIFIHYGMEDNVICGNTISNCDWGVYIYEFATENLIYHNNFINNLYQAFDAGGENSGNHWDNGYEGNYWSDYEFKYPNAKDEDGDGIWDDPYFISKGNKDNYPFVHENGWVEPLSPDLECMNTSISWSKVEPGSIQTATILIKNVGEPGSLLDWEVSEHPNWGVWSFSPPSGENLKPEDGLVTIQVAVIVPDVEEASFSGNIKIVNKEDSSDYCEVAVSLSTAHVKKVGYQIIKFFRSRFLDNFGCLGDEVDQQQTSDLGGGKPFYQKYWLAQGFKPTKEILTRVGLRLFLHGGRPPGAIVEVSIRSSKTGDDLTSCSITGSAIESGSWVDFDFPDIVVKPGSQYYIVLRSSSGDQYQHYCWYFDVNDPYKNGSAWGSRNYGSSWYELDFPSEGLPDCDFCFRTYGRDNSPPTTPLISGPTSGEAGSSYKYSLYTVDPDDDDIYYYIDWGDGSTTDWIGPYHSGEQIEVHHVWYEKGNYIIMVKTKDIYDAESDWATLEVTMPRNKVINLLFSQFCDGRSLTFPLLKYILR